MAVIQDLVLTFCPTMHSVQQKKLKLLMPVFLTNWFFALIKQPRSQGFSPPRRRKALGTRLLIKEFGNDKKWQELFLLVGAVSSENVVPFSLGSPTYL